MRFSSIFAVAAAIGPVFSAAMPAAEDASVAEPLIPRGYKQDGGIVLAKSVQKVTAETKKVDALVRLVNSSDIGPLLDVYVESSVLNDTIVNQTLIAKKAPAVSVQCSDYLQWYVEQLIGAVQTLVKDIIAMKPYAVEASVDSVVLVVLQNSKLVSDQFADVLISKVPASKKALAKQDKAKVDAALNKAIKAYTPASS